MELVSIIFIVVAATIAVNSYLVASVVFCSTVGFPVDTILWPNPRFSLNIYFITTPCGFKVLRHPHVSWFCLSELKFPFPPLAFCV